MDPRGSRLYRGGLSRPAARTGRPLTGTTCLLCNGRRQPCPPAR